MVDGDNNKHTAVKVAAYSDPHPYKLTEDQHGCLVNIFEIMVESDEVPVLPLELLTLLRKENENLNFKLEPK